MCIIREIREEDVLPVDSLSGFYSQGKATEFFLETLEDDRSFESTISYPIHSKETLRMMNEHAGKYVRKFIEMGLIKICHPLHLIDIGEMNPGLVAFIPFADSEVSYNSKWKLNAKEYKNIDLYYEGLPDYESMEPEILTVGVITRMTVNL